jgi:hypothetical protein
MPAQHRRTYGAVYEMALAASFTVVPFIGGLLAGNEYAFRFLALPGGLAITVVPVLIYFVPRKARAGICAKSWGSLLKNSFCDGGPHNDRNPLPPRRARRPCL